MAPEMHLPKYRGIEGDIFAMGVLLFMLVLQRHPLNKDNIFK